MMSKRFLIFFLCGLFFLSACSSTKDVAEVPDVPEVVELDEIEVVEETRPYRASAKRVNDLIHTKLDIRFDWAKRHVIGKATIDFMPFFYPTDELVVDAKGFDIHEVALMKNGQKTPLKYDYDELQMTIALDKEYKRGEKYTIFIDYTAKPDELESIGSAAITADKGLYFINPDGDKDIPTQIWTQGETEANSCWFPTIDKPNEKHSQEIYMTVQDKYKTLSNGLLISSTKNSDGTRTDYWKQDIVHVPYLTMVAVGDYAIVTDTWKGKEVSYYVEPTHEEYARDIFGNTPEMMTYFSELLDMEFPWDKYSQIIVREFVSGAMENTTAVTYLEMFQKTRRELIDGNDESTIAHELFHHWFGNIVTCESWSNLPLNESFANYSQFLWDEYKYGDDEADYRAFQEMEGYLGESRTKKEPLIRFYYDHREDMFDGHSYNKGGRILHMLRKYLGDEAFFEGLNKYLVDNAYQAVEVHDLRLALEAVSGEDLNWYFNQWFLRPGHPILEIDYDYDTDLGRAVVHINQTQEEETYHLPLQVDIYQNGKVESHDIWVTERKATFTFDVSGQPDLINVDAEKTLLCEKTDNKTLDQFAFQFNNAPKCLDRYEAMVFAAGAQEGNIEGAKLLLSGMDDPYWGVRRKAVRELKLGNDEVIALVKDKLMDLAANDPKSNVRAAAISKLGELKDEATADIFKKGLEEESYAVVGASIESYAAVDSDAALKAAKAFENESSSSVTNAIGKVYGKYGGSDQLPYFENNIPKVSGFGKFTMLGHYGSFLERADASTVEKGVGVFKDVALNDDTWWIRYSATKAISDLKKGLVNKKDEIEGQGDAVNKAAELANLTDRIDMLTGLIKEIKDNEKHDRLKMIYSSFN